MLTSQKNSKFSEQVKARRAQVGRKGLRRRAPRWLYPAAIERQYVKTLLAFVAALESQIKAKLTARLPALIAQANVSLDTRADDFVDDIKAIMQALGVAAASTFGQAEDYALGVGFQVANFNAEQYRRVVNATLGVDPFINDAFLQARIKVFAAQNATLITSIPNQLLKDVEGVVMRGLTSGATARDMSHEIEGRFKVTRARARLIGRDQVGKLNAQLTEVRQTRIGVEEYIWNSVEDERVRDSHRIMDGKICRWDDPTVYREVGSDEWLSRASIGGFIGTPGSDYQCRCFPEPIMEDLIDESE